MDSANSTLPPVEEILGYDPWTHPQLLDAKTAFGWIIIGWTTYEYMAGIGVLFRAKSKWKTPVYRSISLSFFFSILCFIEGILGGLTAKQHFDYLTGPSETALALCRFTFATVSKWCYFYATARMVISVLSTNRYAKVVIYALTLLEVVLSLYYVICTYMLWEKSLHLYYVYVQANDTGALMDGLLTVVVPFFHTIQNAYVATTVATIIFTLSTKLPFLWEIFSSLNVPFAVAMRTMATTHSTQRILASCAWAIIESAIVLNEPLTMLTEGIVFFSPVYQINTMSMLAYEGSSQIVKSHSIASQQSSRGRSPSKAGGDRRPSYKASATCNSPV